MRAVMLAVGCLAMAGCSGGPTIRVVVESELSIPDQLDEVTVEIAGRTSTAPLTAPGMLPATVELRASGDSLGPFELRVVGRRAGADVATVTQSVMFPAEGTTTITVRLDPSCVGVMCMMGERCVAGACVPDTDAGMPDAGADGGRPEDGGPPDAGWDAGHDAGDRDAGDCVADELCNARDDDCDGEVDETSCEPCVHIAQGGHVYLACDLSRTWDAARAYCMERGYDLVVVDGMTENDALSPLLRGEPWIGLHPEAGGFVWVDGTSVDAGFEHWQGMRPAVPDCTVLRGNGNWRTDDCTTPHPFVCEATPP
ncbi:MAG: C-type lectin domain-containing protein [Sandaracinaceae bacterium]